MIRKNLFDALTRVWKIGLRKIWADAVCINQSNLDEVAQQVMIMQRIYETATCVIVHLDESPYSAKLDVIFPALTVLAKNRLHAPRLEDTPIGWGQLQEQYGLPDFNESVWQSLVDFGSHPWFQRSWTFQEILVARHCLFVSGDFRVSSTVVLPVFQALYTLGLSKYIDRVPKLTPSGIDLAGNRCVSLLRRQEFAIPKLALIWQRSPLIQLLRETKFSKSTDPRDHVFSLLGVSNEAHEEKLRPNYHETENQTFLRAARFFVKRGYGPQLLENATAAGKPSSLPSWVPRWNDPPNPRVLGLSILLSHLSDSTCTDDYFNASRKTKEAFRLGGTGNILIGQGRIFDSIESIESSEHLVASLATLLEGDGAVALKMTFQYIKRIHQMILQREDMNFETT